MFVRDYPVMDTRENILHINYYGASIHVAIKY
jgi:hypothetical protein